MKENKKCPNCGAPLTTEICPYCHNATGLDTASADMEYPVIDCKEANVTFWNSFFPMIFAFSFGLSGIIFPIVVLIKAPKEGMILAISFSLFAIIGIVAFIIGIKPIIRSNIIKRKGKEIDATVYGYIDDNLLLNGNPAQIVKLLVTTKEGPRFILYQLGDIKHPYKINSKIKLLVYKDIFMVKKDDKFHFE